MSHFTVGVILENPNGDVAKFEKDLEKALAPYQENNMGDCPKEYLEFHSVTEECKKDYERRKETKVRCPNGELISPLDDMFAIEDSNGNITYKVPENEGFEEVKIPIKDSCPTFEEYMEKFEDYEFDEDMHDYGYWENPNAKWDWWSLGGRWIDNLLVKGENYVKGERSLFSGYVEEKSPDGYTWASGGIIKDIDFEKSMEGEKEKSERFWEIVVEGKPLREGEEQPFSIYNREYYIERYGSKEKYAENQSTYHTYALLADGKWISKGEMGWFGMDNSTKYSEDIYIEKFREIINAEENKNKMFVVVDCHI